MAQKSDRQPAKRLKVFITKIGLHEWAVAVSSQKAALKAWDVRENLFASGAAKETHEAAAVEVALKHPGEAVKVPGAKVVVPPANVVHLEGRRAKPTPQSAPLKKRDRSKLDAAEEALVAYRKDAKKRLADMDRKRRLLNDEIEALESEVDRQTRALESRVERERKHYEA
jgi:hypothetical protein